MGLEKRSGRLCLRISPFPNLIQEIRRQQRSEAPSACGVTSYLHTSKLHLPPPLSKPSRLEAPPPQQKAAQDVYT